MGGVECYCSRHGIDTLEGMKMKRSSLSLKITRIASVLVAAALASSLTPAALATETDSDDADDATEIEEATYVTLGADLTDDQEEEVLAFFGLDEDDLDDMNVITVTNTDERTYLEGTVDDSIIGTRTLSCSYVQITSSGGIEVETANLTYVTKSAIYNALQTAGIANCTAVVTAPTSVSGTGALTGIFLAVEDATGEELDEEKKEVATEELVETSDLEDEYGSDVAEVISDVKDAVASSTDDLSTDEIEDIVIAKADEYGVELDESDLDTITTLAESIQDLGYDASAFSETLADITGDTSGVLATIKSFFSSIASFFTGLFGGSATTSILDDLDTSIFELDGAE